MTSGFAELVELQKIKGLMQAFYELTGFPSAIVDITGTILTTGDGEILGAGWKSTCLGFHRVHPTTRRWCLESDVTLSKAGADGRASWYKCLNGLVDAALPVIIDGKHLVNLFTGQFFLEPPDEDFFRQRAREFGFDEPAYLAALKEVPVFSRDFVERGLAFLDMLAGLIAEMGLRQKRLVELNQAIERKVGERTAELQRREIELAGLNHRLVELDRAKTDFFANVSHEFRTPLTLIAGPVQRLLASAAALTDDQQRDLEVVRKNAHTLLRHVNDLLDATRLDAGRMPLVCRDVDLAGLLHQLAGHFAALAPERGIRFTMHTPDHLPMQVDVGKVERIVLNLLSNAFKFTPAGGRVTCTLSAADDGRVLISVEDSGPGIPPDQREIVFARFGQGAADPARHFVGTGLGLAIAREFAMLHGGTLDISEADGGGARFQLALPMRPPSESAIRPPLPARGTDDPTLAGVLAELATGPAPEPEAFDGARRRPDRPLVLVVEDNRELRRFLVGTLSDDFEVATAADGEDGLAQAMKLVPDLIVTDLMMPRLSGDRMVVALRADPALCDIPILVLSARADEAVRVDLLKLGARDYLVKPFSAEELRVRAVNLARLQRARAILQAELNSRGLDIEGLAGEIAERTRQLERSCAELAEAREQAEAASRAKSRFLAMVSHELRSPLQTFELYLTLLRGSFGEQTPPRLHQCLDSLEGTSRRMNRMVTTILQHSAIEGGRITLHPAQIRLEDTVAEVVADMRDVAREHGLTIAFETPAPPLPPLTTDSDLLRLVLVNLIDNAIKFTDGDAGGGGVTVSLARDAGWHRCTVADTGIGIPVEHQERIFEPFLQLEEVTHKHKPGVGLGLALVRAMVGALDGRIEIASEPGKGSAFSVVLPSLPGTVPWRAC